MSTVVEQRMIALPFLDDEVPALILSDGKTYLPVYKVCHALGIHSNRHIRLWKNLALWFLARKLPFRTERQGKRQVWCLPISSVPFLYGLFDWHGVSPERRLQLKLACQEQAKLADLTYRELQWRYRAVRQALFMFLVNSENSYARLQRCTEALSATANTPLMFQLATLLESGCTLFRVAIEQARTMIRGQEELPIIELYKIDAENTVIDSFSMPLLPIVPQEEYERFFSYIQQLAAWGQEIAAMVRNPE
jgi:hypothetical protein